MIDRLVVLFFVLGAVLAGAADRLNVVWIIADDLGPELGCYGYPDVATPNLDRLAKEGVRYTQAFSTAPVCSASRSAFQTGRYQTTIGGHYHDTRDKRPLPAAFPTITGLLQQAGYFVSNGHGTAIADGKLAYYNKGMIKRGLDPEVSDRDYLSWWEKELGVK
jgi:N-sulfoglucosamine sulfohydrolase